MEQRLGEIDLIAWQRRPSRADLAGVGLSLAAGLSSLVLIAGAVVDPDPPLLVRQLASAVVVAAVSLLTVRAGVLAVRRRRR